MPQVLWVSHCGLTGLDGLNALPSLKELYAAFNQIENLEPIAGKHRTFDRLNRLSSRVMQIHIFRDSCFWRCTFWSISACPCTRQLQCKAKQCNGNGNGNAMAMAKLHCHADMETLEMLDLEGNKVDDLGALQYLSWCPQLAVLTLADNPVASDAAYQAQVIKASGHSNAASSYMCTQSGQRH